MSEPATVWWTAEQAAHYLQCGVKVIYRSAARGELRVARIGGRRAFAPNASGLMLTLRAEHRSSARREA